MKSSSFFKSLSWLLVLNGLVKPVWIFFIDRQVQNIVGHEEYGSYFAVLNLSFVLFFLADAGLSNMLNQRIASHFIVNLRQLLGLKLALLLIYTLTLVFVAWLTGIRRWELLGYVLAIQVLTSFFLFLRSILTANQFFTADAWFSVMDKLLMTVFCGSILYTSWFGDLGLIRFLQIQTLCTALAVGAALVWILYKKLLVGGPREDTELIVKRIVPFAVIILLMGMHNRLDGFLLERMHPEGAYQAGIYASAYRLLDVVNMAGYLAGSFLIPFIARHRREKALVSFAIIHTRHVLLPAGLAAAGFVLVFAPWLQQLLYHTSEDSISLVMRLCLASLPAYYLIHIYGALLTATGAFGQWIRILAVAALINIALNLLWIPRYGAQGCCLAALVSQYACGLAVFIRATRSSGIRFYNTANLLYLLAAAVLTLLFYLGRRALIDVWIILAAVSLIVLTMLATQRKWLKNFFISLR